MDHTKTVIICGGGAAGFFTAINLAERRPGYRIILLEKGKNVLGKVRISGGGRCNVTNGRTKASQLVPFYPRGGKKLYKLFESFSTGDMVAWLERHGVQTHTEEDLRVFPSTNNSETIIRCFMTAVNEHNVELRTGEGLESLHPNEDHWSVGTTRGNTVKAGAVVIATGSSAQVWKLLGNLDIKIVDPVPSLFTFNIKHALLENLQGISFPNARVKVSSTSLNEEGPLLITHWGLSGPAVLKISSAGARTLAEMNYHADIQVNFVPGENPESCRAKIKEYATLHPKRKITNYALFDMPKRFWDRIIELSGVVENQTYAELGKKSVNKIVHYLVQADMHVHGKSTFKEEFVTAGGVSLDEIDLNTFESKKYPGLCFTGEVLDIDGLTGGFNFQACWSSAWTISQLL